MSKPLITVPEVSKTIEILFNDKTVAKSLDVSYPKPKVLENNVNHMNMQKKQSEDQKNSILIWSLVDNVNRGEISTIPKNIISGTINSLMNSRSFNILKQICTDLELRNFAVYVIMKGKKAYTDCFTSDMIVDEYPPPEIDMYDRIVSDESDYSDDLSE